MTERQANPGKTRHGKDSRGRESLGGTADPIDEKVTMTPHQVESTGGDKGLFLLWRGPQKEIEVEIPVASISERKRLDDEILKLNEPTYGFPVKEAAGSSGKLQKRHPKRERRAAREHSASRLGLRAEVHSPRADTPGIPPVQLDTVAGPANSRERTATQARDDGAGQWEQVHQKTKVERHSTTIWRRHGGKGMVFLGGLLLGAGLILYLDKEGHFDIDSDGRDRSDAIVFDIDKFRETLRTELVPIGAQIHELARDTDRRLDRIEERLDGLEQAPAAPAPAAPSPSRIAATSTGELTQTQATTLLDWSDGDIDGYFTAHLDRSLGSFGYDTVDWALARNIEGRIGIELYDQSNPVIAGNTRWHEITYPSVLASGIPLEQFRHMANGADVKLPLSDRAARYVIAQNRPLSDQARIALASPANYRAMTSEDIKFEVTEVSEVAKVNKADEESMGREGADNVATQTMEPGRQSAEKGEPALGFAFNKDRERFTQRIAQPLYKHEVPPVPLEMLKDNKPKTEDEEKGPYFSNGKVVEFRIQRRAA